jgi:hypothetical protein
MKSPMNVKISVKEICIFHIVNSFNTASPSHDTTDRLCRCFLLCRIAGEFIVFRCKYMYYFCFFNLFGLFFSLFSRQMCKSSSRNRFPNLWKRKGWRFKWIGYHFNLFFECKVTNNFFNNRGHFKKMSLLIHFHKPLKNKQKRYEQIINFQRTKNEVGTLLHKW